MDWSSGAPVSKQFDDIYFNAERGLEESRHVYLEGNQIPSRWRAQTEAQFVIAELGFGSGLNFCATYQAWRELENGAPRLHFVSLEGFPMRLEDLDRTLSHWPELNEIRQELTAQYPAPVPGVHRLLFANGAVCLDLWFGDAESVSEQWTQQELAVDAWYLDGFAPSKNESMWSKTMLQRVAQLSRPGTTASTFSVSRHIKEPLLDAGFDLKKMPGFGRKREQLFAVKRTTQQSIQWPVTPWHRPDHTHEAPATVTIIGAGLAGCFSAYALAERGVAVTLLDPTGIANQASGNTQAVIYCRIPKRRAPLGDFGIAAYCFAIARYQHWFRTGFLTAGEDGQLCGTLHTLTDEPITDIDDRLRGLNQLAYTCTAEQASQIAGNLIQQPMLYYPSSGWIAPRKLCQRLATHPNIELRTERALTVETDHHAARITTETGQWVSDQIIIASGTDCTHLLGADGLPTRSIRGQTTQIKALPELNAAICHDGYIAPAIDGQHCIGATFDLNKCDANADSASDTVNVAKLTQFLTSDPIEVVGHRVGFRCTTPDYLPVVGAVPDLALLRERFGALQFDSKRLVPVSSPVRPRLSILTGLGSRGLTYAPLAAEILASSLMNEPLPIDTSIARGISPMRFAIRQLIRSQ